MSALVSELRIKGGSDEWRYDIRRVVCVDTAWFAPQLLLLLTKKDVDQEAKKLFLYALWEVGWSKAELLER